MQSENSLCMQLCRHREGLVARVRPRPQPAAGEVLLRVLACGVCRTDLHVIDGELAPVPLPVIPGHEIVGEVVECGPGAALAIGSRVGVPWLGWTCGSCTYCKNGQENLCDNARFTGYHLEGGYAQHAVADARYCFELPTSLDAAHAAPLLCAGLIGYRSWRMAGQARRLGIYGFGAAAHLVAQVARWAGQEIYAFTRPGDVIAQQFALEMGACWAGDSNTPPPVELDAAIIFAPLGSLVPSALAALRKAGTLVCGGIHMSDIPPLPYSLLWGERRIQSVANLTRQDGTEFLALAARIPIVTQIQTFALQEANDALQRLRAGDLRGAAVLVP